MGDLPFRLPHAEGGIPVRVPPQPFLVAGALVMLGRVPIGAYIKGNLFGVEISLVSISDWMLNVPNLAAKRGIMIGVGLGMTATALKIVLGIEQTYLGRTD